MGALGPKRVCFEANGSLPKPPVQVLDNQETWLWFSDLVFVDPIGTGFSRVLPPDKDSEDPKDEASRKSKETQFWEVERDLKSLGEFMQRFLSPPKALALTNFYCGRKLRGFSGSQARPSSPARFRDRSFGGNFNFASA